MRLPAKTLAIYLCLHFAPSIAAQCALWEIDAYSDAEAGAQFGLRVAIGDTWAAVGSVYDDTASGSDSGSVRILQKPQGHWIEYQSLYPDAGGGGDWFGAALAMRGGLLAVGAPNDDDVATDAGAVYLYRLQDGAWSLDQKILASDGEMGDHFGSAVAIDGARVVVGAPEEDALGSDAGAAYLFAYDGVTWNQSAKLLATSFGGPGETFGVSVDLDGGTVLVGAPGADVAGPGCGVAYAMVQVFGSWIVQARLAHPQPKPNDLAGYAVQLDGEGAILGIPGHKGYGGFSLFERNGTLWSYKATVVPSDYASGDSFGAACALSGDWLVIGSPFSEYDPCCETGAAYLFERIPSSPGWAERQRYIPCDTSSGDHAGVSVSIHSGLAIIGSPLHGLGASQSGSAYIIEREGASWTEVDRATANGGLSASAGGTQTILLRAGPDDAGRIYFLGGTMSGTSPGVQLGAVVVPLNIDTYALYTLNNPNSPVLPNSFGFLDGLGAVDCSFTLPAAAVSAGGLLLHHAYVVLDPVTLELVSASAAEPLALH